MLRLGGGPAAGYETIAVATTAAGLDAAKAKRASRALIAVESGSLRIRVDGGAATADDGHKLGAGDSILLEHADHIAKASLRRVGPSACTVTVSYLQ